MFGEYFVLVPLESNDGVPFSDAHRRYIEGLFIERFGGYSVHRAYEGAWRSPGGVVYHNTSDAYTIASSNPDEVYATVYEIGMLCGQQAMYTRFPNGRVFIIRIHEQRIPA